MAVFSACHTTGGGDEDPEAATKAKNAMRDMFGPGAVDQQVRAALSTCWMMFPEGERTPANVEREFRRIVDRALASLAEDAKAFGFGV